MHYADMHKVSGDFKVATGSYKFITFLGLYVQTNLQIKQTFTRALRQNC